MRTTTTLALLALLLPLAAHTADLTFQIDGQVEYDDNALRQNGDEDDDVLFRFTPLVKLHEDRGQDLRYSLHYAVPFEFAVDNGDELDDVDHRAGGDATYRVNDRLEFFVKDRFRYLRSALRDVEVDDVLSGDGDVLINQERDRVTLNDAEGGLRYRFTPRLSGQLMARHELYETDRDDRSDNWLLLGTGSLDYIVTPKHSVGLGVRVIHQEFDDRTNIPGSTTDSYNAFAQWTWRISETLQFQVAAGPTLIETDQDDPVGSVQTATIPFLTLGATDVTGLGLLNEDGTVASGPANPGSIVVSQEAACPTLTSTGQSVFAGNVCPFGGTPTTAGIFLDGIDDAPIIANATAITQVVDPFAEGESDSSLDLFAFAVVRKDWTDDFHSALRYERTQGGASGLGGAVIRDSVNFSHTWDFAERWQASVRSDFVYRQSVADDGVSQYLVAGDAGVPGFSNVSPAGAVSLVTVQGGNSNEIDTIRYGVAGRITHRLTRNTSGWVQLTYNEQSSDSDTLGDPSDFNDFLAVLGVRHVFDPIKLW
ncbi:MAG: hypothetical protein ACQGVC_08145 [Myxococcota bacterium]